MNDDKAPLLNTSQGSNVQPQLSQNPPPPFLSGVPMVNPVNYGAPTTDGQQAFPPQPQMAQQPIPAQQYTSQAQSVVANMATYSSSKYRLKTKTNSIK